jgi:recombinational DNA repair ATPase RecF
MLLSQLKLRHLKRIDELPLDFRKADGSPREWTVMIGRNGTAKTTILQAIALAAAGKFRADKLVDDIRESLPDKRVPRAIAEIEAQFTFGPIGQSAGNAEHVHPTLDRDLHATRR